MRKVGLAVAAVALSATTLAVGAGPAQAGAWGGYKETGSGVPITGTNCVSLSCWNGVDKGWPDQRAQIHCWRAGQSINGDAGWGLHDHYLANGAWWGVGYSPDSLMWWVGNFGRCGG